MVEREETWGYDQQDRWHEYYCPVSEDEVDPRMGSVVWFVPGGSRRPPRMTHRWCYPDIERVLGHGPTYREVEPPTIVDRQRFIPGVSDRAWARAVTSAPQPVALVSRLSGPCGGLMTSAGAWCH